MAQLARRADNRATPMISYVFSSMVLFFAILSSPHNFVGILWPHVPKPVRDYLILWTANWEMAASCVSLQQFFVFSDRDPKRRKHRPSFGDPWSPGASVPPKTHSWFVHSALIVSQANANVRGCSCMFLIYCTLSPCQLLLPLLGSIDHGHSALIHSRSRPIHAFGQ